VLTELFYKLRKVAIPVSPTEWMSLLAGLDAKVADYSVDNFYYLARTCLVKDEKFFDRFDQVFGEYFKGQEMVFDAVLGEVPLEWLQAQKQLNLTEEEKAQIESLGGWDKLMETLKKRLEEQKKETSGWQ
jgi:hypothetical protein